MIVSLQELGGIISVYSDQEKLLRPPGGTTADLLNTAEMASIVTILPPTVLTFKILEEKDFGPNYFDSKKNQSVNKSFIISTNKQPQLSLHSTYLN